MRITLALAVAELIAIWLGGPTLFGEIAWVIIASVWCVCCGVWATRARQS